jgi:hypothetical protein
VLDEPVTGAALLSVAVGALGVELAGVHEALAEFAPVGGEGGDSDTAESAGGEDADADVLAGVAGLVFGSW